MAGREYCMAPSYQVWKKVPATLSPCLKRLTFEPMETTSPAPSERGMRSAFIGPLK